MIYNITQGDTLSLFKDSYIAFGVFDGCHNGHKKLINKTISDAQMNNQKPLILTFDIDPSELFESNPLKIYSNHKRISMLDSQFDNVDIVVIHFDWAFASQAPLEFLNALFFEFTPKRIYVGENFRFGHKAQGDTIIMTQWGNDLNCSVETLPLFMIDDNVVSSSLIRKTIKQGNVEQACRFLGEPYSIEGTVQSGKGLGMKLGFATANLGDFDIEPLLGQGVYGGISVLDNKPYVSAISVGKSQTISSELNADIEVHLLDFNQNILGKRLVVNPTLFLRDQCKFDSLDDLKQRIALDIQFIRNHIFL